jgi:hypothetical protein
MLQCRSINLLHILFMKRLIVPFLTLSALSIILISCSKSEVETDPAAGLTKIAEGFAAGAATKVEVYSNAAAASGYQKFWFALYDSLSGKRVDEAQIKLMPMMDMGTMKHSAPYENPASFQAVNQLFEGAVFFIMSSAGGSWTLSINIRNNVTGKEGALTIPVTVAEPKAKRMLSFTSAIDNTSKYFIALVEPSRPKVGINDLEFVIGKRSTMMSFPADSSMSVTFEPEMPTMNHGSPNNVNPVHAGMGHYKGKVNFTMTGLWRLHLQLKSGDAIARKDSIDIEF